MLPKKIHPKSLIMVNVEFIRQVFEHEYVLLAEKLLWKYLEDTWSEKRGLSNKIKGLSIKSDLGH